MPITEAKKNWSGTVGLSSASQLINGTLSRVLRLGNLATPVHQSGLTRVMHVELLPTFKPHKAVILTRSRHSRAAKKREGKNPARKG